MAPPFDITSGKAASTLVYTGQWSQMTCRLILTIASMRRL
ncbi:hypothetical protein BN13_160013 [Nostocoides jenkinsii Ben 74]|uniref:Uncharacterized protein n=1 Tax=Nostocoides jenkinsii Ben 74 TaxID=1193518 RepID=A0A077M4W9_9MICO|nr:hypothetical protein BN13_160013 [Tetrasphaera jenkinsii Ben 74]